MGTEPRIVIERYGKHPPEVKDAVLLKGNGVWLLQVNTTDKWPDCMLHSGNNAAGELHEGVSLSREGVFVNIAVYGLPPHITSALLSTRYGPSVVFVCLADMTEVTRVTQKGK